MKKQIVTFILIFLGLCLMPVLHAQTNNGSTNGGIIIEKGNWPIGPHQMPFCYDMDDFPNGFPIGQNINIGGYLQPTVHPEIFATFTVEIPELGMTVVEHVPVTNDSIVPLPPGSGPSIYAAYMIADMDMSFLCDYPNRIFAGNYTLELTTTVFGGSVHVPYPISMFSGPGDIFDDAIFDINSGVETGVKNFCCFPPTTKLVANPNEQVSTVAADWQVGEHSDGQGELNNGRTGQIDQATSRTVSYSVAPNPFQGFIRILITENAQDTEIELFNLNGALLQKEIYNLNEGNSTIRFDTHGYPAGMYFLKIKQKENVETIRLVKSN